MSEHITHLTVLASLKASHSADEAKALRRLLGMNGES